MKIKLLISILISVLLASCAADADVEAKMYSRLETQFKAKKVNLAQELDSIEHLLIQENILKDKSAKSREAYLKFVVKHDSFPQIENRDISLKIYDSPLNFQALSIVVKNYLKNSKDEFEASKFSAILKQLESYKVEDRSNPAKIAKSIVSNLDPSDYDKPFYRALTLILIVHSMTDDFETKDFVIKNEDDFYRRTGIHSYEITIHGCFPFFRERAEIALNNKNQILFKGERLENIETLSDEVSNIFTINRGLGKQKTNDAMRSPGNEGYNFPFYSYTSKEDLTTDVNRAIQNYDRAKSIPNMQLDMLAISSRMIKDCLKKKIIAQLYGKTLFPEISLHAELQVLRLDETDPTLLEKVYAEIFESIDALRSKESESVFDETYSKIKSRQNIFLNDFRKLRLLEVLFSLRVTENPNQFDPPEPPYYP